MRPKSSAITGYILGNEAHEPWGRQRDCSEASWSRADAWHQSPAPNDESNLRTWVFVIGERRCSRSSVLHPVPDQQHQVCQKFQELRVMWRPAALGRVHLARTRLCNQWGPELALRIRPTPQIQIFVLNQSVFAKSVFDRSPVRVTFVFVVHHCVVFHDSEVQTESSSSCKTTKSWQQKVAKSTGYRYTIFYLSRRFQF